MASAVDIITYVGIPLAVLGVLPTIYTCLKSFFTLREISRTLVRNNVNAITRSALLTGIVEIEIPRLRITPLDRHAPGYFGVNEDRSELKGGSWTLFKWKEMTIGKRSYRLQYHDELSQPQAEIEFEALVAFLLDRGAVPYSQGWADLKEKGLWTPAGTKLLVSPVSAEEVLYVALSDDSDGILSLALNWRREWDRRDADSLPPYWVRVASARKDEAMVARMKQFEGGGKQENEKEKEAFLDDDSAASAKIALDAPVRLKISSTGVQEAYSEDDPKKKLSLPSLRRTPELSESTTGFWFCCAATAFQAPQGGLWSFSIPEDVTSLARRETVPGGVMVLLGAMNDEEVPAWRTPYDDKADRFERHVKFLEQSRRINEEMRLPPEQREAARMKRVADDAADFHTDHQRRRMKEEQRRETEVVEALQSKRLPISIVAEANRKWLLRKFELTEELATVILVEQILFGMVQDESFARRLSTMLDLWKNWSHAGGMTKSHYLAIREDQVVFSLASLVLFAIRSTVSEPIGSVVGDLQECLRVWKKVRLG